MLQGKRIILGVTGGIAVYKAADLVSRLRKQGAIVEVIMTEGAAEFVTPLTFQTMSENMVHKEMFNEIQEYKVEHISLAQKADVILVAPATANTIGKVANGLADNLLTTVIMATKSKVIIAPAMNTEMYNNPIVKDNIHRLKNLNYEFIQPGVGLLACGDYGEGKMAEPQDIVDYLINSFTEKDLIGKRFIVTAGPTIEPLDPVRYITNHSSGKMGYDIAEQIINRGGEVILISGPSALNPPCGAKLIKVNTTLEMFEAVGEYFDNCHVLIKAAAPSDYRPEEVSPIKIKKKDNQGDELQINFIKNPDIVAHFGQKKNQQIIVGFAAETNDVYENALSKIEKKNLDFIVANDITEKGAGFKGDTNIVTIIDKNKEYKKHPLMDKKQVAQLILDKVINILNNRS